MTNETLTPEAALLELAEMEVECPIRTVENPYHDECDCAVCEACKDPRYPELREICESCDGSGRCGAIHYTWPAPGQCDACHDCAGLKWVPISPQEAGWVLMLEAVHWMRQDRPARESLFMAALVGPDPWNAMILAAHAWAKGGE